MKLVIIEGIGKKETVEKYLGKGYKVFATRGHVRDLPAKTLAVNVKENFEPKYETIPTQRETVKKLAEEASKAEQILLATDPDREGEAISWHVANILGLDKTENIRIAFNEISKNAIQEALKNPRPIDENLVNAQQARRVLDRLVGYKLSPILCRKIQSKLSAGRVQSVTLRLIVEREREIRAFKPEEYWPFAVVLEKGRKKFKAALTSRGDEKIKLTSKEQVDKVVGDLDGGEYTVTSVKKSVTRSKPFAPFTTSTMQQDALNKLGMSLSQTTQTAQNLYEGIEIPGEGKVALVTYIRTDSTRVSAGATAEAREFIEKNFGKEYVPTKPNVYATKKSAQDAHEAIRPITLSRTPESLEGVLSKPNYKLYKLIYDRFLASQMSDATYDSLSADIVSGDYGFRVVGKTPKFAGYTAVYKGFETKDEDSAEEVNLPNIEAGDKPTFSSFKFEQKFTKPPARYTEASIVKAMEEKGIGRPATYTPTVTLLFKRGYTEKEGKMIKPTELGEKVTDMLIKYFPDIMNVKFTAAMEEQLDEIEDGERVWQSIIGEFYNGFEEKVERALQDDYSLKKPDEVSDVICSSCGAHMVIKQGRYGKFLACPNYPKCKNTQNLEGNEKKSPPSPPLAEGEKCSKCGKPMVLRKGKFGQFWACSGYPKCKNIINIENKEENYGNCPLCGKPLKAVKGKSMFFGCSGYPECKFTSAYKVSEHKCPECGSYMTERSYGGVDYFVCANKECGKKFVASSSEK